MRLGFLLELSADATIPLAPQPTIHIARDQIGNG
jgi:hypothetical protein